jgi:hypothetical protein
VERYSNAFSPNTMSFGIRNHFKSIIILLKLYYFSQPVWSGRGVQEQQAGSETTWGKISQVKEIYIAVHSFAN